MPRPVSRLASLVLLPLLLAAQCGSPYRTVPRLSSTIHHALAVPTDARRVEVLFHDGLLAVLPGDQLAVEVEVELLADDQDGLDRLATVVLPEIEDLGEDGVRVRLAAAAAVAMETTRTNWRVRVPPDRTIVARTRKGGVVARGAACRLEVDGGLGVVDARLAGGSARLATTSGSIMLRGGFQEAEVRSNVGRIDVSLPRTAGAEVRIADTTGETYVDVPAGHPVEILQRGAEPRVEVAPELRVDWQQSMDVAGVEYTLGRIGAENGAPRSRVRLDVQGRMLLRALPATGN